MLPSSLDAKLLPLTRRFILSTVINKVATVIVVTARIARHCTNDSIIFARWRQGTLHESTSKRHIVRFSHYAGLIVVVPNGQTPTDISRLRYVYTSVAIARIPYYACDAG